jgi:hypothetical protein
MLVTRSASPATVTELSGVSFRIDQEHGRTRDDMVMVSVFGPCRIVPHQPALLPHTLELVRSFLFAP